MKHQKTKRPQSPLLSKPATSRPKPSSASSKSKPLSKSEPKGHHKPKASKSTPIKKPPLTMQTTTLWDYPSQHYGESMQGDKNYRGATPSYIIWNLLQRYTQEGDLVIDPMCGSGTTIDVAKDIKREVIGFDLVPSRPDIKQNDARDIPLKSATVDFVFIDPPYSTHIDYSDHKRCIGKLSAFDSEYFTAMGKVIAEIARVLKPGKFMALYVSDTFEKGRGFIPIGFELFQLLSKHLKPVDIVSVVRHNKTLFRNNWHTAAVEGNFFLRGFNYLFIMQKS